MRHLIPLTLLLTTACTVGPNYTGPSAATPPPPVSFVRAQNAGVAAPADGPWWTTLRDPLLDKLVTQALKDSPDLSAAAARIRQARATLRERRAADLPSISSSALFAKARLPGQSEDGGATDLTLYNLGFDSSWELDLFGGRSRGLEATRADVAARTAELEDARVTLSAEVARTYVTLRERQQRLALAEAAIALRTREVELLRQRAASGTVGRDALLAGQQALDDARAQSGPLRAEIDGAKDRLALLAGRTPGSLDAQLDAPAPVPLPPAEVAIGDPAALLKRRPDIRVAERTLAAQTARRLSCDASIVTIVEDESGQPLDVGRKTRSIPPAIRRALHSRDAGCRFPGCTHTRFLDGHHIRHWANGGETKLSTLVMLCRFHHRQVHEGRVDVQMLDDGALRFIGTRGQHFEAAMPMAGDADQLARRNRIEGIVIDAVTAVSLWRGERMSYDLAVEGLMIEQERGRRRVSAETQERAAGGSTAAAGWPVRSSIPNPAQVVPQA